MKILLLTFYYPPDLCACSFRSFALVESIQKKMLENDQLFVFTTQPNRYSSYLIKAQEKTCRNNVTIYRFKVTRHKSGFVDQALTYLFYARQAVKISHNIDADIIVASSSRLMTGTLGAYLSIIKKCKYYLDIRDIFPGAISEVVSRKNRQVGWVVGKIFDLLESYVIRKADKVNVVSEGFYEYYANKNLDISHWTLWSNGVDDDFINCNYEGTRSNKKKKRIVYAGNIGEGQGLEKILPYCAYKLRNKYEFIIIGDGSTRKKLKQIIDDKGIKNLELIEPVGREELLKYYRSADILFLHLNDHKAFQRVLPSKIFEYVAMGKPIVAGVAGFSAEFLRKNASHAIVFDPCDQNGCISSILKAEKIIVAKDSVEKFVHKYRRDHISGLMAQDILDVTKRIEDPLKNILAS